MVNDGIGCCPGKAKLALNRVLRLKSVSTCLFKHSKSRRPNFKIGLNLKLSEDVYSKHIGKHNSEYHDNISTLPDIAIYSKNGSNVEFVLAKRYRGLVGIDSRGNFAEDFLIDMGKSFQDPSYNSRHFNCGIFAHKDIMNELGVTESLPADLVKEVKNSEAGICLIGYWTHGPKWMTRFGELFSSIRLECFISNTEMDSIDEGINLNKVNNRLARGRKILKRTQRKEINNQHMKYMLNILKIVDKDGYTFHYWITDVIFRFIGEYTKYLNIKLNPPNF